jgi:hypothetical protein
MDSPRSSCRVAYGYAKIIPFSQQPCTGRGESGARREQMLLLFVEANEKIADIGTSS